MKGPILPGKNLFSFLEGVVVGEGINEITLKLNSVGRFRDDNVCGEWRPTGSLRQLGLGSQGSNVRCLLLVLAAHL